MEGADGERAGAAADQQVQALAHLAGGTIGEGHRHDAGRVHVLVLDQVGDAVDDDAGLARARAGQDEERPGDGLDRFALAFVEAVEQVHRGHGLRRGG